MRKDCCDPLGSMTWMKMKWLYFVVAIFRSSQRRMPWDEPEVVQFCDLRNINNSRTGKFVVLVYHWFLSYAFPNPNPHRLLSALPRPDISAPISFICIILQGSHLEIQYSLMTFAVRVSALPISSDGVYNDQPILDIIERHRKKPPRESRWLEVNSEMRLIAMCRHSSVTVLLRNHHGIGQIFVVRVDNNYFSLARSMNNNEGRRDSSTVRSS